jgi:LacI family transcriptional regulator, galactose operon repressor
MPITIRDIAKKLNLSIAAVSRAMDGYPDISEETRQRVIETARQMGYVPNLAARQLRRQKADAIGYILPSETPRFADPFFSEFLSGLGDETALHPFDLLVSIAPPGAEAEQAIYRTWTQSRKVDGFILDRLHLQDWRVRFLAEHAIPFVGLEQSLDDIDYPRVQVANVSSMASLVAHLVGRGFRRIAFIGGPDQLIIQNERLTGYRQGLEAMHLDFDPELAVTSDLTSTGGYQATMHLRSVPNPPDAIMCINDETAFGGLHALRDLGIDIGKDVAVTGFDGVAASAHSDPPLTTLDIPVYEIARKLVDFLATQLDHRSVQERQIVFTPRLLKRLSTGDSLS